MAKVFSSRLQALDFSDDIQKLTDDFTGRHSQLRAVDAWLRDRKERFCLLTGGPGAGKSALAARLTQVREDVLAYHFCIDGRSSTIVPETAIRSLAAQLLQTLPGYGEALVNAIEPERIELNVHIDVEKNTGQIAGAIIENLHVPKVQSVFDILLCRALKALQSVPSTPCMIVVDSLDEAVTHGDENLVSLLTESEQDLPGWLRLFVTTRDGERRVLEHFAHRSVHELPLTASDQDLQDYIAMRIRRKSLCQRLEEAKLPAETFAAELAKLADANGGNFLYTSHLLNEVEAGRYEPTNVACLPDSLSEIYHRFLQRFRDGEWATQYRPIFQTLAVAKEPLVEQQLADFSGVSPIAVREALRVAIQFLIKDRKTARYRIFHQSLRDYLVDAERNQDRWCAPGDGHEAIVNHYLKTYRAFWQTCDEYGLRHLSWHLMAGPPYARRNEWRKEDILAEIVTDVGFLEAKTKLASVYAALADLRVTSDFLLPKHSKKETVVSLVHVLDREAHHLQGWNQEQYPVLFRQQLHNGAVELGLSDLVERATDALQAETISYLALGWSASGCDNPVRELKLESGAGPVEHMAITADGRYAVFDRADGSVWAWQLERGAPTLRLSSDKASLVALAKDNRSAIVVLADGTLWSCDLQDGTRTLFTQCRILADRLILSPNQRYAASAKESVVSVSNLDTGNVIYSFDQGGPVRSLAASDQHLAVGYAGRKFHITVCELASGKQVGEVQDFPPGGSGSAVALALNANGQYGVVGCGFGRIVIWSPHGRGWIRSFRHSLEGEVTVYAVAMSANGRYVLSGASDATVKIFDTERERIFTIGQHVNAVTAVAVTWDGHYALSGSQDGTVKLWDLRVPNDRLAALGHQGPILAVNISYDGGTAVTGSKDYTWDGTIKVWDLQSGHTRQVFTYKRGYIHAVAVTPRGNVAFSAGYSNGEASLKAWDLEKSKEIWAGNLLDRNASSLLMVDNWRLAIGGDGLVDVWDIRSDLGARLKRLNRKIHHFVRLGSEISALGATMNGRFLVAGSARGAVFLWDLTTGSEVQPLGDQDSRVMAVAVTEEGDFVLAGSRKGTLKVWDLKRWKEEVWGLGLDHPIIAFARNHRYFITGSAYPEILVWDLKMSRAIALAPLRGGYARVALNAANDRFVVGDSTGTTYCFRYVEPRSEDTPWHIRQLFDHQRPGLG